MDMVTVDVTDLNTVNIGDDVELWGENISIDEVAKSVGTISYELLCKVTNRVNRTYID